VSKAVLLAAVPPPYLVKTDEHPDHVDGSCSTAQGRGARRRAGLLHGLLDDFFDVDLLMGMRISEQAWASSTSPRCSCEVVNPLLEFARG
jgi:non-heme chloroperoxidase